MLQRCFCVVPSLCLAIGVTEIFKRDEVVGIKLQRLLELLDRFVSVAFACRQEAKVVPSVGKRAWITLRKLEHAFERGTRIGGFVLLQVDAAETVERFGII